MEYYDLGDLLYGGPSERLRWVIREGLQWYYGPLLGDLFDAAVGANPALVGHALWDETV